MKKASILIAILAAVAAFFLLPSQSAEASKAIAEQEDGLVCTACHDKPGSKLLTDKGKYWELTGTLDDYDKIESAFGKCTHCHSRKPGSQKLTKEGKAMLESVSDMDELRQWVLESHPVELPEGESSGGDGG